MVTDLAAVMTFNPVVVTPTQSLAEVVELMNSVEFHHWPVVDDDQRLVGMLSDVDVVRAAQARCEAAAVVGVNTALASLRACRIDEFMTRQVHSIPAGTPPRYALQRMLGEGIHALPVLDHRRVVGLLTSTDFLRELSYGAHTGARLPITEITERSAEPLECDASLDDAFAAMQIAQSDFVGVVRGHLPLGIVTRRQARLAKVRATINALFGRVFRLDGPERLLDLVASTTVLRPGASHSEAAVAMLTHQTQALAVVTHAGRLLGAVAETRLLQTWLDAAGAGT